MRQRQPVDTAVGSGDKSSEGGIASPPGSRFQPFAGIGGNSDAMDAQRNRQARTDAGAKIGPGVGMRGKTVMDMHGREIEVRQAGAGPCQRPQQCDRITAAGKSDADAPTVLQSRREESRDTEAGIS